jgi:alpha-tubulin suppressor-like RCC1 family protein
MKSSRILLIAGCFLILFTLVPFADAHTPIPVAKVSGGEDHTLILTEANTVWSCGYNSNSSLFVPTYVLGDGTDKDRYIPVQVYDGNMNTATDCRED